MKKIHGVFYAMLSSAAFGFLPIFAKIAFKHGTNSITFVALRFLIASLILLAYFIISKIDFKLSKQQIIAISLIGITGYSTTSLMLTLSYKYISAGLSTTMHFVYPAIVTIFTFVIYKEKLKLNKIMSLTLSTLGVYALVGVKHVRVDFMGAFLAIFSGVTYAACIIAMGHEKIKKIDSRVMTFYLALSSGITMLIVALIKGEWYFTPNPYTLSCSIGIALISTVIAIILFVKGIKIIGTSSAAILSTFEPIVSIIMGIIILGEKLTFSIIVGSVLIILSVIILSVSKDKNEKVLQEAL